MYLPFQRTSSLITNKQRILCCLNYSQHSSHHEVSKSRNLLYPTDFTSKTSPVPNRKDDESDKVVLNPCNIQMISETHHSHLFPGHYRRPLDPAVLGKIKQHLEAHHLWGQKVNPLPSVNLNLPPLYGENIDRHFQEIAMEQVRDYKEAIEKLLSLGIPARPREWLLQVTSSSLFSYFV